LTTVAFGAALLAGTFGSPGSLSTTKVVGVGSAITATLFFGIVLLGQLNSPH
jgi:hypothetical protein